MRGLIVGLSGLVLVVGATNAKSAVTSVLGNVSNWQDAGIDVTAGQMLYINSSGTVYRGFGPGGPSSPTNPDGLGPDADGSARHAQAIAPDAVEWSLVAKVGGTEQVGTGTFVPEDYTGRGAGFVGSSYCRPMTTSGRLYFAFNDALVFGDNSGTFSVNVGVVPEPSTLVLLSIGAIGLLAYVWRRRRPAA